MLELNATRLGPILTQYPVAFLASAMLRYFSYRMKA